MINLWQTTLPHSLVALNPCFKLNGVKNVIVLMYYVFLVIYTRCLLNFLKTTWSLFSDMNYSKSIHVRIKGWFSYHTKHKMVKVLLFTKAFFTNIKHKRILTANKHTINFHKNYIFSTVHFWLKKTVRSELFKILIYSSLTCRG